MRETRYLWIGNLAENVREDRIADYFRRYGKIDKVRFLSKRSGENGLSAYIAFMDIRSAQKAKTAVNIIGDRELLTDYFDPVARAGADEGQRHIPPQPSQSRNYRRYETVKDSGIDDRPVREIPAPLERSYQASDPGSNDSDKGRPRVDFGDGKSRPQASSKRRLDGKAPKKKDEDGRLKLKKGKPKITKERGRSPTVRQRKSCTSSGSSPSRSGSKRQGSSSEGRSSTSASAGRSVSEGHRSSSVSSSSSTGSSNSSKTHRSNSASSESSYEIEEKQENRKLVAMCIRNLPSRPTITSIRDGIFHEFKKYGKVKSVLVRGDGNDRHALVLFRTAGEANKAIAHARTKLLFGVAIEASIYEGEVSGQELEECGGIIDEFHPRASRTLFVGNLDKTVGYSDIQNIFVRFGEIVAIEIKKQHNIPQYAFLQYTDIMSVVRAITKMDGEKLGRNTLKLGFGKTVISSCLWVDGVTDSFTENYLTRCFMRYGPVKHVVIDRNRGQALVFYSQYDFAQSAMQKMRARKLNGSRLKLDYASNELVEIFLKHMKSSGQSFQGLENIRQLLQPPSSPVATPLPPAGAAYARTAPSQEPRAGYYEERHQPGGYNDEQYADGNNYRRGWRARSRERHGFAAEQTGYNRPKRGYDDAHPRQDYHRDPAWEHESYPDGRNRGTGQYDQDYRQRDHDLRREHRGYPRKQSTRTGAPYEENFRYRGGARDRYREERDADYVRDRDQSTGDRYYNRTAHLSPSHPRYHPRRSRSASPQPRDPERYGVERGAGDAPFRRRGSASPEARYDSLQRLNSMESKSSTHSDPRYPTRGGDVDMREYLDEDKLSVPSPRSDERIVEFTERARKSRSRKRAPADLTPANDSLSPRGRYDKYRDDGVRVDRTPESFDEPRWHADSPAYSEHGRSVSGTPTRDENEDLIGEVIIKKSGSKSSSLERTKPRPKEEEKPRDKDYRKEFAAGSSAPAKSDSGGKSRSKSRSTSLIQRVHSPPPTKKDTGATYEKDFDYRKQSKPDSRDASRHKHSKSGKPAERVRGDRDIGGDRAVSPAERRTPGGGPGLLKREYSPKPKEREDSLSKRARTAAPSSSSKEKYKEHKRRPDSNLDRDERPSHAQKRRHSPDSDQSAVKAKRERKKSTSDHHKHKSANDAPSQKHEAPLSIASQMFMQDEEDSGNDSTAPLPETVKPEEQAAEAAEIVHSDPGPNQDKSKSPSDIGYTAASLSAALSLLPKAFTKPQKQTVGDDQPQVERKKDGALTELEKEKVRLQQLLSKLDSDKRLNPKDAEEVADVVLQELTEKARSKLNELRPQKVTGPSKATTEVVVDETVLGEDRDQEVEVDDVTFEEEVVVDTIEEVTEDEIIETEVEEVTVKEEEEELDEMPRDDKVQEEPTVVSPVVPPTPMVKPVQSADVKKETEDEKKALEKLERKRESQIKKIFKRQEKERKKQIERVQAMRGPSQSVISSVDDDDVAEGVSEEAERENVNADSVLETSEVSTSRDTPVLCDGGADDGSIGINDDNVVIEEKDKVATGSSDTVLKDSGNEELWPPDRGKEADRSDTTTDDVETKSPNGESKAALKTVAENNVTNPDSPVTPVGAGNDTLAAVKISPRTEAQSNSSVPQKPAVALASASQTSRTPVFTTPSPASSSSSSSKSHKHRQMKMQRRHGGHPGRIGQSKDSRPHGHHGSQEHRRSSTHSHRSRSHSNAAAGQHKSDAHKRHAPQLSRRSLATITVGLDASPSKPLSKNELERLRHELESVRNQLNAGGVSPSSLSPCSDDEPCGKSHSPAQLLSPISPLLKSPGNVMTHNRRNDSGTSSQSPASGPSLTDRLKLLGKVKKRSSGLASEVKVKTEAATLERVAIDGAVGVDAKLCRSSIIDQDLARLSYISDHLSGHEFNAAPMSAPPVPLNVPLFAGSKFLQPVPVPQMLPVPLNSVAPSAGVDPVPCNPPTPVSSSDGPKNVLSLSSSDLPVTAERPRDAFGKKTNTSTMDYGSEDAMEISKHEPEPTLLPDPLERDAELPCVSQNLCDTEIIPSHSSKNSPAKSAISEDRAVSPVSECVDASQTRQDALKVDAESVCAEDLEAGGCMEISVDAEDSENLGDVIIDDNVVEEITEDLKSEMETGRVVSDAETQPEKVAKAETVDGDIISKKPDEIVDVIAEIKQAPSTSGENEDAQIKKEKPKVGKKKILGKSDLPKTPKIAVKRKLSKEGKKEKIAKKDGHKKPKGDAHKTKSKVSEERAKPTDSDKESTGEKVAERTASDDEVETSQAKTKSKEESGSKKTDDGVSKKRISEKKSVPADAKTDKKAKAKAEKREKGEVIGSAVAKEDRKLTESKSPSIRPEGSESRVDASPHLVKKKKKKHGLDKREKHSEKKTVGSTSEDKSDSKNKDGKSVREGEKNKKNPVEKSKTSENLLKTSEKSGLAKRDSKQVKSVKAHSDLKASHSAPPSSKTVPGPVDNRKKLKKTKKHEKPAKKRLVISSDSSDESVDERISSGMSKFPQESESRIVSEDDKWSDVDDNSRRSKSHWSMSSASSLEPFVTGAGRSSMLTTETIKSETIMPVGYDRVSFSDSSASEDESRSADVFREKKRKKKSVTKSKDLKPETESKRLFGSCSDSDMSETQLVMSLTNSESSDEISVPKKSFPKRSAMAFSDDLDSSDSETPPKKTPKPQLKAAVSTAAFDHKVQSKKSERTSKKGDGKSAKKLAKMAKKEKRRHDLSSDNEPDVGFKLKSKHSTKVKKSDASREPSPSFAADKPESKSAKSAPLVHQPKDKSLAKAKKHKDQKARSGKSDSGRLVPGHDHDKKQSRPESVEAAKKKDSAKDPDKKSSKSERFDFGESSKRRDSPKIASDHDSDKKSSKSGKVDPGEIGKKRDLTKKVLERDSDKRLSKSEMHEFGEAAKPKDSSKILSERDTEKRHKSGKFDDVGRKKDSGKISKSEKSELGESTKKRDAGKAASERDPDKKSSSKPDKVDSGEIGKRRDPVKNAPEHVFDKKSSSKSELKEKKQEHDTEKTESIKKKDPKISSKSSAPKPEDGRKESWQKPDRDTTKHKKKSSKKHKKSDFSRSDTESAKGKDERTKKDRPDKTDKEDWDKLKKHKKVAPPVQPESTKQPEPIKTDENQNKDITYSLFGSDSDDDDIGFTIDEEYDSSRDVHKSQLLPDHGEETVPTEADAGSSPIEKSPVVQRGRSFLSSGSDDSDKEQKSAVKSALSVLGRDRNVSDTQADILLPSVRKPKSPTKLPVPPRPRSLSPLKKVSEPRDRKRSHDLCEVKGERPNVPGAGYPTGQRRHHFGVVDRRENMDKMKSISHEREEEAVRSIMGILDESSDADSYFSDVKVDETVATQQNLADKTESDDVDAGADVVKPVPGRDESQSEDNEKGHESSQEKENAESDLAKERSTAEENELAAAVSAIEGLFGDFADEDRPADSFLSDASPRPSSRRVSEDKTTTNEPGTSYDTAPDIISREVSPQAAVEKCHEESFVAGNSSRKVSADKSNLELPSVRTDFADGRESFVKQRSLTLEVDQIRSSDSVGELPPKAIDTPWVSSLPESRSERTYQTSDVNSASVQPRQVVRSETAPEPAPARLPVEADNRPAYMSQPASINVAMPVQNLPFVTTVPTPEPAPMATSSEISTSPFVAVSVATGNQPSVLPSRGTPPEPQRSQISVGSHGAPARSPVVAQEPRTAAVSTSPVGGFLQRPSSRPELPKKPSDPALSFANAPSALHHPRASIPSQSAVSMKSTPTSAPHAMEHSSRIPYSHAPKTPYLGYPESMMPIHNQGHAQQPFGLPQNRFSSSQTPAMMPYAHPLAPQQPQQPDTMQRTLSSPYLLQHSAPAPHIPPAKIEVSTPTRNRDAPKLPAMNQGAETSESQRTSSSNPNLAASSVPNIPQIPHPYLHPQQANMQQKQVFSSHLYYPNPGMPHYPNLSPYMPPFLGMRPNLPSVPIVRTPPEEPQRQTPKPQTPQQRSMTPYRPRLEQPAHIPSSRPLPHVNPQMAMHPSYNVHHAQQDPSQTAAIHQTQLVKHESNQYQAPRVEHGERYVRADNEQSQMDMVDQHFAMSGVSSNLPPGHQNQTVKPESKAYPNHDTQPSTTHHQPMPGHGNMYQQVIPRHALNMPPRLLMHGEKYGGTLPGVVPTMQWPYPAPGGNFRPPSVGQQPSPVQARVHPAETYQGHAPGGAGHSADAPDQVMDLFQRYPVIWQGLLALKNDSAAVQTHFICGDRNLAQACLPQPDSHAETDKERNLAVLRIVQRMRLEPHQLEGIDSKITENSDYCLLLALPCGRDKTDVNFQQTALKRCFIDYLKQKQAAGIVNVQHQQMRSDLQYVLHVFPPCDFTTKHLQCNARDLLSNINDIQHIMIVIAAV